MRNINSTCFAGVKARLFVLMLASLLSVSVNAKLQNVAEVSAPVVRKVQAAERKSKELVRFSIRLYRFYKLSSEKPVAQAPIRN